MDTIYWLAVLVAGISAFVIGGIWYSPGLFGNAWMKDSQLTEAAIKNGNKGKIFGFTALFSLVMAANLAMFLRPNEATVLYNAACAFCMMPKKPEALDALRKAWEAGFRDAIWARRDPDLALLRGDPEFERLYPAPAGE